MAIKRVDPKAKGVKTTSRHFAKRRYNELLEMPMFDIVQVHPCMSRVPFTGQVAGSQTLPRY